MLTPNDIEALNYIAVAALQSGALEEGIDLLVQAINQDPTDILIWANLGLAYSESGDWPAAETSFRNALTISPDQFELRLRLGDVLLHRNQRLEAVAEFNTAILAAQAAGQWRSVETTPPHLHSKLNAALGLLARYQGEWLRESLDPVIEKFGRDSLKRVERCLAGFLRESSVLPASSLQRPKLLFFPNLNSGPFFSSKQFSWIEALENDTSAIRQELTAVTGAELRQPFLQLSAEAKREDYLGGLAPEWTAYFFYRHGKSFPGNLKQCPRTASRLASIPLVSVPGNAPEVLFSFLGPDTHILPHTGVTNTRVVVHLPLIVPEDCGLVVGGQAHRWEEGRCVIFDDTYEHEAWNKSDKLRVVLILDVWNPEMTVAECAAISALVPAIERYRSIVG